jgi:hypothetical protein
MRTLLCCAGSELAGLSATWQLGPAQLVEQGSQIVYLDFGGAELTYGLPWKYGVSVLLLPG